MRSPEARKHVRKQAARALAAAVAFAAVGSLPREARAFCGFYVSGADARLFNNATQVVLMREGTRTVLSMQNNYQGPPQDFAMVVPVPIVLQKDNVKTLSNDVFRRVDELTAPRLVEYWEEDPCQRPELMEMAPAPGAPMMRAMAAPKGGAADLGVTIEAHFEVGEYDIVILSAKDALGLDTWLRQNNYKIPAGAEPYLRPYVQGGMKFFVAKVNVGKVRFENGQAMLSPLRFHYDSEQFNLPIRLGLINSGGTQDLIVHLLARGQRYEVANYDNVAIPTNIDVADATRDRFGSFYAALFDKTLAAHPRSVVTEYAWDSGSCDPCPVPALRPDELATLGLDVLPSGQPTAPGSTAPGSPAPGAAGRPRPPGSPAPRPTPMPPPPGRFRPWMGSGFVVTRLHVRYTRDALGDDLVFKAAPPIVGGREFVTNGDKLEEGAQPSSVNNFQARYAIRHPWTGPITCKDPVRGRWGGPPGGTAPTGVGPSKPRPATNLAFAVRTGVRLESLVRQAVPPASVLSRTTATAPSPASSAPLVVPAASSEAPEGDAGPATPGGTGPAPSASSVQAPPKGGCAGCSAAPANGRWGLGVLLGLFALPIARRRRRPH